MFILPGKSWLVGLLVICAHILCMHGVYHLFVLFDVWRVPGLAHGLFGVVLLSCLVISIGRPVRMRRNG